MNVFNKIFNRQQESSEKKPGDSKTVEVPNVDELGPDEETAGKPNNIIEEINDADVKPEDAQENEKIEDNLLQLEAIANEIKKIELKRANNNLEQSEELREKLKLALALLTTMAAFTATIFLAREHVQNILSSQYQNVVEFVGYGVSFLVAAFSGAYAGEKIEERYKRNKNNKYLDVIREELELLLEKMKSAVA